MTTTLRRSRILGMGAYVPERVVSNEDLKEWYDTNHEWIVERTGIVERRWIAEENGETNADLAVHAAKAALKDAGIDKEEIDMVVYSTCLRTTLFLELACSFNAKWDFLNLSPVWIFGSNALVISMTTPLPISSSVQECTIKS